MILSAPQNGAKSSAIILVQNGGFGQSDLYVRRVLRRRDLLDDVFQS